MPKKFVLLHVTDEEEFATEQLGRFIKLRVGIVRTRQCIKNSKDIAEVVDHNGRSGAGRQPALRIPNLPAEFIPNLGQGVPIVFVANGNRYSAAAALRS